MSSWGAESLRSPAPAAAAENVGSGRSAKPTAASQAQRRMAGKRVALGDLTNVAGGAATEGAAADDEECLCKRSGMEQELEVPVESANHERAENATWEVKRLEPLLAVSSDERDRLQKKHTMLSKQNPASLKDMLSALSRMKKIIRELERTIDESKEMICHGRAERIRMNERLCTEVGKVKSLEQEVEQLRLQVGPQEYTASSTEVLHTRNNLSAYHIEAKQTVETVQSGSEKTSDRLQELEDLKVQAGHVEKQPVVIELSDDENTSPWNGKDKRSLKSDPSCSVKLGFIKEKHVIEIGDDEYMWSCDDRKRSLKLNPSCRGEPDVETVPDCCDRRPFGSAPCFTPWGRGARGSED